MNYAYDSTLKENAKYVTMNKSVLLHLRNHIINSCSEVNEKLKEMSSRNGFHFIDNSHIDGSSLNGSKLHLNAKGSAYLATSFIKILRPSANKARRPQGFHAPLRQLGQLIMQLASGPIRAPVHKKPRR